MSKPYEYSILNVRMTTPTTTVVTLRCDGRRKPMPFAPGQYASVSFIGEHRRQTPYRYYSVASAPTEERFLQFALQTGTDVDGPALTSLEPGSKVAVEGPLGSFSFDPERDQSAMFLADNSGIAPFLSMIRYAARLHLPNQLALVYSCPEQNEIPFLPELIELHKINPEFGVMFAVGSGPTDALAGEYTAQGRLDGTLLDYLVSEDYAQRSYFICGSTEFMSNTARILLEKGAAPESVKTEEFDQGDKKYHR